MALLNYTGKNVFTIYTAGGAAVRLLPGINELSKEELLTVKSHPLFNHRVKKGIVQIMADELCSDGKRSINDMLEDIPKIVDVKLLKKIIENDGRDIVVSAAKDQLAKIKDPAKAKQKESEDGSHFT